MTRVLIDCSVRLKEYGSQGPELKHSPSNEDVNMEPYEPRDDDDFAQVRSLNVSSFHDY